MRAVAAVLVLMTPVASAGVNLDGGIAFVDVDDHRAAACHEPAPVDACLFEHSTNGTPGFGDDRVDVYEDYRSVRVGLRPRIVPVLGPLLEPVIPEEEVAVEAGQLIIRHPLFSTYEHAHATVEPSNDSLPVDVEINESGINVALPEPRADWWFMTFAANESDASRVSGYDHTRIPNVHRFGSTDDAIRLYASCFLYDNQPVNNVTLPTPLHAMCTSMDWPAAGEAIARALPDIVMGAEVHHVAVAPDAPSAPTPMTLDVPSVGVGGVGAPGITSGVAVRADTAPTEPLAPEPSAVGRLVVSFPYPVGTSATASAAALTRTDASPGLSVAPAALAAGLALALILALYQRLRDRDLPNHPSRAQLLAIAAAEPGISLTDLARRIGIDRKAVEHHARLLAKARFVVLHRRPGHVAVFPPSAAPPWDMPTEVASVLLHPTARRVLAAIREAPGARRAAVARAVGEPRQSVEWHIARLIGAGRLREDAGRRLNVAGRGDGFTEAALAIDSPMTR